MKKILFIVIIVISVIAIFAVAPNPTPSNTVWSFKYYQKIADSLVLKEIVLRELDTFVTPSQAGTIEYVNDTLYIYNGTAWQAIQIVDSTKWPTTKAMTDSIDSLRVELLDSINSNALHGSQSIKVDGDSVYVGDTINKTIYFIKNNAFSRNMYLTGIGEGFINQDLYVNGDDANNQQIITYGKRAVGQGLYAYDSSAINQILSSEGYSSYNQQLTTNGNNSSNQILTTNGWSVNQIINSQKSDTFFIFKKAGSTVMLIRGNGRIFKGTDSIPTTPEVANMIGDSIDFNKVKYYSGQGVWIDNNNKIHLGDSATSFADNFVINPTAFGTGGLAFGNDSAFNSIFFGSSTNTIDINSSSSIIFNTRDVDSCETQWHTWGHGYDGSIIGKGNDLIFKDARGNRKTLNQLISGTTAIQKSDSNIMPGYATLTKNALNYTKSQHTFDTASRVKDMTRKATDSLYVKYTELKDSSLTIIIAASNSRSLDKKLASFVCDGTNDDVEIDTFLNRYYTGTYNILFASGTYNFSYGLHKRRNHNISGTGDATIFKMIAGLTNTTYGSGVIPDTGSHGHTYIKNLQLDGNVLNCTVTSFGSNGTMFGIGKASTIWRDINMENLYIHHFPRSLILVPNNATLTNIRLEYCSLDHGLYMSGSNNVNINGLHLKGYFNYSPVDIAGASVPYNILLPENINITNVYFDECWTENSAHGLFRLRSRSDGGGGEIIPAARNVNISNVVIKNKIVKLTSHIFYISNAISGATLLDSVCDVNVSNLSFNGSIHRQPLEIGRSNNISFTNCQFNITILDTTSFADLIGNGDRGSNNLKLSNCAINIGSTGKYVFRFVRNTPFYGLILNGNTINAPSGYLFGLQVSTDTMSVFNLIDNGNTYNCIKNYDGVKIYERNSLQNYWSDLKTGVLFDNSNYFRIANNALLNFNGTTNFSMEALVELDSIYYLPGTDASGIAVKTASSVGYGLQIQGAGTGTYKNNFAFLLRNGTHVKYVIGKAKIGINHVVATVDRTLAELKLYINGELVQTNTDTFTYTLTNTGYLHFGYQPVANTNLNKTKKLGLICMYNKVLSNEEVNKLYNSGKPESRYLPTDLRSNIIVRLEGSNASPAIWYDNSGNNLRALKVGSPSLINDTLELIRSKKIIADTLCLGVNCTSNFSNSTTLTSGSIPISNGSIYVQDTNLFYNATTHTLGLGTSHPYSTNNILDINGNVRFTGATPIDFYRAVSTNGWFTTLIFSLKNSAASKVNYVQLAGGISSNSSGHHNGLFDIYVAKDATLTNMLRVSPTGIGIGTTAIDSALTVLGGLSVRGIMATANITTGGFIRSTGPDSSFTVGKFSSKYFVGQLYISGDSAISVVENIYKTVNKWYENGAYSYAENCTLTDSTITIGTNGFGYYKISISFSSTHSVNNTGVHFSIFVNDVEAKSLEIERKIGTGGDFGNSAGTSLIRLKAGDIVKVKANCTNSGTLTISHANFNLSREN